MDILIKFRAAGSLGNLHIYKMQTEEILPDLFIRYYNSIKYLGGSKLFAASQKDDESWLDGSKLEEVVFDYNNYCYFNVIFQTIKVMNDFKK